MAAETHETKVLFRPLNRNNFTYQCLLNIVMANKMNILQQCVLIQPDRKIRNFIM
jgi:hypothetical protein